MRYTQEFLHKIFFVKYLFKLHIKTKSKFRLELFARFANYNDLMVKIGCVLYLGAAASIVPYPVYMYFFRNEKVPFILMFIPGIDENTISGYSILMFSQFFLLIIAILGMSSCDLMYITMISNIPIFARLIEDEINELQNALQMNRCNTPLWKVRFRNLLVMHQEMTM